MASLITGATGFIGQTLLRRLVEGGEEVVAISRQAHLGASQDHVDWRRLPESVSDWGEILEDISTVYHFGWSTLPLSSNEDPYRDAEDNILGSLRLLEAVKRKEAVRLVFASSGGTVYGPLAVVPADEQHPTQPRCAYGVSKLTIEKYLTLYRDLWGLDCVALRIGNPYGPGQKVGRNFGAISTFATCVAQNQPITIFGDGTVVRDYIYISDVIDAIIAAGHHRGGPMAINIGSGVGKSLNEIIETLREVSHKDIKVNFVAGRNFDVPISVLDVSLAAEVLLWKPRMFFERGVEATLDAIDRPSAFSESERSQL